jgi:protein TonB
MRYFLLTGLFLISANIFSQKDSLHVKKDSCTCTEKLRNETFSAVQQEPQYPGGSAAMHQFLQTHLDRKRSGNVQGMIVVQVIIDKNGNICSPKVLKEIQGCEICTQEAIRVIKAMPRWNPGKQNGHTTDCLFNLPVNF